jgi:hypothetical protein
LMKIHISLNGNFIFKEEFWNLEKGAKELHNLVHLKTKILNPRIGVFLE